MEAVTEAGTVTVAEVPAMLEANELVTVIGVTPLLKTTDVIAFCRFVPVMVTVVDTGPKRGVIADTVAGQITVVVDGAVTVPETPVV